MQDYREAEGINYSLLKKVATNPKSIIEPVDISDKPSVKRGDLLDILLAEPAKFEEKYACFQGEVPTRSTLVLADATVNYIITNQLKEIDVETVLKIVKANKLWASTKDPKKLEAKFNYQDFWDYVKFRVVNQNKLFIDKETYEMMQTCHKTILEHEFTFEIFDEGSRELLFQVPIFTTLDANKKEYKVKALADVISIDHENKIIYPYDFKFLEKYSASGFPRRFLEMYYYIQAGLYTHCIKQWAKENYPDYNVLHYRFIVISDKNIHLPIKFDTYPMITKSFVGFEYEGKHYPGIYQLLEDLDWHKAENLWNYTRELYENKGELQINF